MLVTTNAPYAANPIPIYLGSLTGTRFRTLNCMECGQQFIERNGDTMYRIGDSTAPAEISISSSPVSSVCGHCAQQYTLVVEVAVGTKEDSIPLYMQPQSVYIVNSQQKKMRDMFCLECGKPFQTISDRISQVTDNRIPFEYLDTSKLGPITSLCSNRRCGQTWALMV